MAAAAQSEKGTKIAASQPANSILPKSVASTSSDGGSSQSASTFTGQACTLKACSKVAEAEALTRRQVNATFANTPNSRSTSTSPWLAASKPAQDLAGTSIQNQENPSETHVLPHWQLQHNHKQEPARIAASQPASSIPPKSVAGTSSDGGSSQSASTVTGQARKLKACSKVAEAEASTRRQIEAMFPNCPNIFATHTSTGLKH